MAKTEKAAEAAAAQPAPPAAGLVDGLRATRRVEHDGVPYGPGEAAGDVLPGLTAAQAEALVLCGAAEAPAADPPAA